MITREQVLSEHEAILSGADTRTAQTDEQDEPLPATTSNDDFLARLKQSESSGNSQAEITIKDGRRFVGALQFGAARLADFKKHSGKRFTQDQFKANEALQDEVAQWHFQDIDKAIDALGVAAKSYSRDGLKAVAHLGGNAGMAKYVRTNGVFNPADELGTSLQDYYDRFATAETLTISSLHGTDSNTNVGTSAIPINTHDISTLVSVAVISLHSDRPLLDQSVLSDGHLGCRPTLKP